MKPYRDPQTGVWNGLPDTLTTTEFIQVMLSDNYGNGYPCDIELEVTAFTVDVINVARPVGARHIPFNNPEDDIKDAIRNAGYKDQEINFGL